MQQHTSPPPPAPSYGGVNNFVNKKGQTKKANWSESVPKNGGILHEKMSHLCTSVSERQKKKKKRTCFQFVFKFSPFYNSGLCKDSFFCLPINKTISSNFRYLRVLIIVQLFVFWVWICCVRISIMVRFIVTNIRGYTRWSAGLWVGWFLHCFCEKQLHLWEKAKRKPRVLNV